MATVTSRAKSVIQPGEGYIGPSLFIETVCGDSNIKSGGVAPPFIVGMAVDYLSRFMLTGNLEDAFKITRMGIFKCMLEGNEKMADDGNRLIDNIKGLDEVSVSFAIKAVTFDAYYRGGGPDQKAVNCYTVPFSKGDIANIITMVNRTVTFFTENKITSYGFNFRPDGYSEIVNDGDGDYLTEDTLWDLKVSKYPPTSVISLQLAMYYIMGQHSGNPIFDKIDKVGVYNPLLNKSFIIDMKTISKDTVKAIECDVIGYRSDADGSE